MPSGLPGLTRSPALAAMRLTAALSVLLLASRGANAGLAQDILDALQNAVTCTGCHALLIPLKTLALLGDKPFVKTVTAICKVTGIVDDDVCEGAVSQQGPVLAHDLRRISAVKDTSTKLCNSLLGLCEPPKVKPWTVTFPKPAPTNPKAWVSTGKAPYQVAHFTDIHIDREYTVGAEVNCTKPICCRNYADQVGEPISVAAGPVGHRTCDTSPSLAHSLFNAISANNKFAIFTGDMIEAAVWLVNRQGITASIETFNNELQTLLGGTPIFPSIGNHEAAPANLFPLSTTKGESIQWLFDLEKQGWTPLIGAEAANQVAHNSGSYSRLVAGTKLRILSINTVYWYKFNFWLYESDEHQRDPNGILAFVISQLQAAEDAGERVWIIAHMPPGMKDTVSDQSNYFDQIVNRYKNTIAGQFYGHTHEDQFIVGYSDWTNRNANTASSMQWVGPSITPRSGHPAFKIYDVDPDTYEVMNARIFRTDVNSAQFQISPSWEPYYDARAVYSAYIGGWPATSPLNATFWHKVTEAFETNDAAFQTYQSFRSRGADTIECDAECKKDTICDLRAARSENICTPAFTTTLARRNMRRDAVHPGIVRAAPACDSSSLTEIFQQLHTLTPESLAALETELEDIIPEGY